LSYFHAHSSLGCFKKCQPISGRDRGLLAYNGPAV
jgi:hypothetical protein